METKPEAALLRLPIASIRFVTTLGSAKSTGEHGGCAQEIVYRLLPMSTCNLHHISSPPGRITPAWRPPQTERPTGY